MDDVRVHYNSPQPAHLQALAYTQGADIHVAPGQEKHLPHEAWHVVRQKHGRVKPTLQTKGIVINDDGALERGEPQLEASMARVRGAVAQRRAASWGVGRAVVQFAAPALTDSDLIDWCKNSAAGVAAGQQWVEGQPIKDFMVLLISNQTLAGQQTTLELHIHINSVSGKASPGSLYGPAQQVKVEIQRDKAVETAFQQIIDAWSTQRDADAMQGKQLKWPPEYMKYQEEKAERQKLGTKEEELDEKSQQINKAKDEQEDKDFVENVLKSAGLPVTQKFVDMELKQVAKMGRDAWAKIYHDKIERLKGEAGKAAGMWRKK